MTRYRPPAHASPKRTGPRGFVLLTVLVFLLLASLLALNDLRSVTIQQRAVFVQKDAGVNFATTEGVLYVMEAFAVEELANISAGGQYKGIQTTTDTNASCPSAATSDPNSCKTAFCSSSSKIGEILNTTSCSFCPRPSPGCKSRVDESKSANPWIQVGVKFKTNDYTGTPNKYSTAFSAYYNTYMEYLGMSPCDSTSIPYNVTAMGTYGTAVCPGGTVAGSTTPRCSNGLPTNYMCPIMRVTVSNIAPNNNPLRANITLQSTVIGASGSYPARRIAFRQVLPN